MNPKNREPGLVDKLGGWDKVYRELKTEDLPWNAGKPDSDLVRLMESGVIPPGPVLDLGVGPGHDAAFLAQKGFDVTAIDISPTALALARKTARAGGVESRIEFREEDVLELKSKPGAFSFVYDRGCFHLFESAKRPVYLDRIGRALKTGGHLSIRTFSDKVPPGPGPYRFTREELLGYFKDAYELLSLSEGIFEGPRRPEAWLALFEKT